MEDKKTILITGYNGFIGKNLVKALSNQNLILYNKDITQKIQIDDKVDCVVHLAAKTDSREAQKIPGEYYRVNILGTLNILEFCRSKGSRLVFASTGQVCGKPKYLGVDEKHPTNPDNPYTKSKLLAENLCKNYSDDFGVNCIILRFFNVYGPGQKENFFIPKVIFSILRDREFELNDISVKRDFIYIDDIIDSIKKAIDYTKTKFEIFNIATGKPKSVKEIVSMAQKTSNKKINVEYTFERKEVENIYANISKAKKVLGFVAKTNLDKGLKKTYEEIKIQSR